MTNALLVLAGLAALVAGAGLLVRGAGKLAMSLGISPLVVGLTVVAFGTSSPELAVSVQSAWEGRTDLAVGNVVGSNVFNVLFILGLFAVLAPLVVSRQVIRQEVPIMVGASLLLLVLTGDGAIGRLEAGAMFVLLAGYTAFLVVQSRREQAGSARSEVEAEIGAGSAWDRHWAVQVALVVAGLALLVAGSDWLVTAAIAFARALGVSELVIGLTIVAAGTSAPEVAASVMATIRGEREMAETPPAERVNPARPPVGDRPGDTPPPEVPAEPVPDARSAPAPTATRPAAATGEALWSVQVGAVRRRDEAEAIVKRLKAKGYDAYVFVPEGDQLGVFRVRIGSFKDKREAEQLAERVLREDKRYKPWVTR